MNAAHAQGEGPEQEERISALLQIAQNAQRLMASIIVLGIAQADSSLLGLRGSARYGFTGLWPLKLTTGLKLGLNPN